MGLGAYWYSPKGFGKAWMKEIGMTEAKMKNMPLSPAQAMGIGFVVALVTAFVLAQVVRLTGASTFGGGVVVGFWVWLGFLLTVDVGPMLWEGKTSKLTQINAGYHLVQMVLMAGIIATWG